MINNISGRNNVVSKPPQPTGSLSEEEIERRQLERDIMSRLDFKDVRSSIMTGRRRFNEAHIAQGGGPRTGVFIPASEDRLANVAAILKQLRAEEEEGTLRMSLIDKMLANLEAGNASDNFTKGAQAVANKADDPAVILELSENAKTAFQPAISVDANGFTSIDVSGLTEAINSGELSLVDSGFSIRMDAEALLEALTFQKNSIEAFVADNLAGNISKAEAHLVAFELGQLINSSAYNNGVTIEERAINRETGLRIAEYFAQTYFNDPDEAKAFMDGIRDFAERDAMLDKGYYFWEGQAYESYKPHPLSIVWKRGDTHWSKETEKAFEANEKKVIEIINKAIASMNDDTTANKLEQILEKFALITDIANEDGDLSGIQWVLDIQKTLYS